MTFFGIGINRGDIIVEGDEPSLATTASTSARACRNIARAAVCNVAYRDRLSMTMYVTGLDTPCVRTTADATFKNIARPGTGWRWQPSVPS